MWPQVHKTLLEDVTMEHVGLRELKNRLGHYVQKVREGEVVEVTDRGCSVAYLVPSPEAALRKKLEPLIKKGLVSWSGRKPKGPYRPIPVGGKPASEIIVEDRE
jgi:prevent-host-death family protein